jgi:Protein of unknown function (DUF2805).
MRDENKFTDSEISEIIEMTLSDDVSFDSIRELYGINSDQIKRIMKANINSYSYKTWRDRVRAFSERRKHYK